MTVRGGSPEITDDVIVGARQRTEGTRGCLIARRRARGATSGEETEGGEVCGS